MAQKGYVVALIDYRLGFPEGNLFVLCQGDFMKGINEEDIYDEELVKLIESRIGIGAGSFLGGDGDADGDDETLVQQAIEVIGKSRRASTTALQRHLKIGFARAGRIMDMLEERGIV